MEPFHTDSMCLTLSMLRFLQGIRLINRGEARPRLAILHSRLINDVRIENFVSKITTANTDQWS